MDEDAYIERVGTVMDSVDTAQLVMDCYNLWNCLQGTEIALGYSMDAMKYFVQNIEEPFVADLPWNEVVHLRNFAHMG